MLRGARDSPDRRKVLTAPLSALRLNRRASNALLNNELRTVSDVVTKTEAELLRLPNLGRHSLAEIKAKLLVHGLTLHPHAGPRRPQSFAERLAQLEARLRASKALVIVRPREENP